MIARLLLLIAAAPIAVPVWAQDHSGHAGHAMPVPAVPPPSPAPPNTPPPPDHETMDHGSMDHGAMDHGAMHAAPSDAADPSPGPVSETSPPPEAGSGPPRAADAIWGAAAMAASRDDLRRTHGDFATLWVQGDRLEARIHDGADVYLWDLQGYYGGPTRRFWFKSEGEGAFGDGIEDAEVQGLYAQAIAPFWDVQVGVRQDLVGPSTTHAVAGVQGLAPGMYEIDAALFLSHRGDLTAKIEAELDQRITQHLILQPRAEVALSAQDIPQLGIGAGIDAISAGVRLRYELLREFAPYVGVEQSWRLGKSADYARADGHDPSTTSFIVGVRFWF